MPMAACLVYATWPDEAAAAACARGLIAQRLAACVTLLPAARSFYRWQGAIEDSSEVVMLAKTEASRAQALRDAILAQHPYDLPCVLAVDLDSDASSHEFLQWVATETT
jgi:periplasmic divalent cation tolerance protein